MSVRIDLRDRVELDVPHHDEAPHETTRVVQNVRTDKRDTRC